MFVKSCSSKYEKIDICIWTNIYFISNFGATSFAEVKAW